MEHLGAEGQWTSLSGIYTADEEADFMALLLSNSVPHNNHLLSSAWPVHESPANMAEFTYGGSSNCSLELSNSSFCSLSRGSSSTSGDNTSTGYDQQYYYCFSTPDSHKINASTDSYLVQGDREDRNEIGDGLSEGNGGANHGQSSSSCCSGDDSINGGQEMSGGDTSSLSPKGPAVLNSEGKMRARRGSATDPQSLYARKRRERINERLRILQNIVPNGTKVDISTMLEEAVQYVKFLQLQIKLLSSDELWMYAPIAYNGMDIGLDRLKLVAANKL
ncbi:hypothetical protein TIFTF001_007182 [Ficus carica]|uniref:BHLH domain-containing protein n=1 Tax=Ficus carica TaxID=3494 RepID=A0AA87ZPV1_FICCA|nr:hypothetical protein TIFTF001_007182 [Ficus carica]